MEQFNRPMKIGIIGASGTAYKRTLPALKESKLCKVVAVQCRNLKQGKQIAKEYNIPEVYQHTDEMCKARPFDIAFIATPPFRHLEDIQIAARHQKHIICEKPLARNYGEGLEIAKSIKGLPIKFMIAHHLRHQPAVRHIKDIIHNGRIGNVLNAFLKWGYQVNQESKNANWKLDKSLSGGGSFLDVGSHCIDIALSFFGEPNSIYSKFNNVCLSSVEDHAIAILQYDSSEIIINTSFCISQSDNCLEIQGTKGLIKCHNFFGEKAAEKIALFTNDGKIESLNFKKINLYKEEVEHFILSIMNGTEAKPDIEDSLKNMRIIEAAVLSDLQLRPITIDSIDIHMKTGERI